MRRLWVSHVDPDVDDDRIQIGLGSGKVVKEGDYLPGAPEIKIIGAL